MNSSKENPIPCERADVACPKYTIHICHHNVLRKHLSPISCKPTLLDFWLEEREKSENLHETVYNVLIDVQGRGVPYKVHPTLGRRSAMTQAVVHIIKPTTKTIHTASTVSSSSFSPWSLFLKVPSSLQTNSPNFWFRLKSHSSSGVSSNAMSHRW